MDLFIIRHGIAEDQSSTGKDSDRQLTEEGIEKIKFTVKALKLLNLKFDLILSSPYVRAWETASLIAEGLGLDHELEECPELASGEPAEPVVTEVARRFKKANTILIAGHEPDLSRLISIYISGGTRVPITMKKGSLARISFPVGPAPGKGILEWLLAPKHLVALGSSK